LGQRGEHKFPDAPAVPAFAKRASSATRADRASGLQRGPLHASSPMALARIAAMVSRSGSAKRITRSARDRKRSSTASMKLVVVTKSTDGSFFAISSMPSSTASVARWTSTGFASKEAAERLTAKLLDLVDQHHGERAARRDLGDGLGEEARHVALALAQHVAREGVGIDLDQRGRALARERERRDLREAARHGGLAGAGRAGEHDEAVRQPREHRQAAGRAAARGAPARGGAPSPRAAR
jgi:hypothetical protein